MTAATLVGSAGGNGGSASASSCTVAIPAGAQAGDLCIVIGTVERSLQPTVAFPTGGYVSSQSVTNTNLSTEMGYKVLTAGDLGGNMTVNVSSVRRISGAVIVYRNAGTPVFTHNTVASGLSFTCPSVTPATADSVLVAMMAAETPVATFQKTFTSGGSYTEQQEAGSTSTSSGNAYSYFADQTLSGGAGGSQAGDPIAASGSGSAAAFVSTVVVPTAVITGSASMTSASAFVGAATALLVAAATMTSGSSLSGQGNAQLAAASSMTSGSSFGGTATRAQPAAAAMTSGSALTGSATASLGAASAMTSATSLTGAPTATLGAAAVMTSASALTGAAARVQSAAATMVSASALTGQGVLSSVAVMTSASSLSGAVTALRVAAASMTSATSLSGTAARSQPAAAAMTSASSLSGAATGTGFVGVTVNENVTPQTSRTLALPAGSVAGGYAIALMASSSSTPLTLSAPGTWGTLVDAPASNMYVIAIIKQLTSGEIAAGSITFTTPNVNYPMWLATFDGTYLGIDPSVSLPVTPGTRGGVSQTFVDAPTVTPSGPAGGIIIGVERTTTTGTVLSSMTFGASDYDVEANVVANVSLVVGHTALSAGVASGADRLTYSGASGNALAFILPLTVVGPPGAVIRAATAKLRLGAVGAVIRAATAALYSPQQIYSRIAGQWVPGLPNYAQSVKPFETVTLHAGTWTQVSGPAVTLVSNTFEAPAEPGGAVLVFTDGPHSETVTVSPWYLFFYATDGMKAIRPTNL